MLVFKAVGTARAVFNWIKIQATTEPMETDVDWWYLRLWISRN